MNDGENFNIKNRILIKEECGSICDLWRGRRMFLIDDLFKF